MRASVKYHHLNNIKAHLRDKKMTPLVIHRNLISKYTELSNWREKKEKKTAFTLH